MTVTPDVMPVNLLDLQQLAQERLAKQAFDYYVSGANDEITLRENREAFSRIFLSPKMLVDVSARSLSTTALGQPLSMPVMIAPTAFQRMAHPDGEVATVRAAGKAGTAMTLSTLSTSSIEEVLEAATGPVWFQLYVYKDRGITASLVRRAEAAGCKAIVLTVDSPMLGRREADVKNRFHLPDGLSVKNLMQSAMDEFPTDAAGSGLAAYIASLYETALTWKDVEWLRSITDLPVLVKGIMRPDDALMAVQRGVNGIVVSNHGGRQLDTVSATITVLPRIVEAVNGNVEVFIDGGIRRGTDVLKALAYGARAVMLGRPIIWGLALEGDAGVGLALELLRTEIDLAMALSGIPDVQHVSRDLIYS